MAKICLALDIPPEIAAHDIAEIPERPDSIHRPIASSQTIANQQFILLHHGRLLQTKNPRRNPATHDGGHHDGDIYFRILIKSRANVGDPSAQTYGRDTFDPANQTHHHILHRLTQRILHNSFRTTTTIQPMAEVLKNR
jgi:hypothetical protein